MSFMYIVPALMLHLIARSDIKYDVKKIYPYCTHLIGVDWEYTVFYLNQWYLTVFHSMTMYITKFISN